jgi:hypothetical protein
MDVVLKIGKRIIVKRKRSAEQIARIRTEKRHRRQNAAPFEEYVTEMRLFNGIWELP